MSKKGGRSSSHIIPSCIRPSRMRDHTGYWVPLGATAPRGPALAAGALRCARCTAGSARRRPRTERIRAGPTGYPAGFSAVGGAGARADRGSGRGARPLRGAAGGTSAVARSADVLRFMPGRFAAATRAASDRALAAKFLHRSEVRHQKRMFCQQSSNFVIREVWYLV